MTTEAESSIDSLLPYGCLMAPLFEDAAPACQMAEGLAAQLQQPDMQSLTFEERLGLLVDLEWAYRQNRRLARLLKVAPAWRCGQIGQQAGDAEVAGGEALAAGFSPELRLDWGCTCCLNSKRGKTGATDVAPVSSRLSAHLLIIAGDEVDHSNDLRVNRRPDCSLQRLPSSSSTDKAG